MDTKAISNNPRVYPLDQNMHWQTRMALLQYSLSHSYYQKANEYVQEMPQSQTVFKHS